MVFFCDSRVLEGKLASPFGHPTQVSTQVQLASTCDYFPVRLTRALMEVTRLALTWIGWPNVKNLRRPACQFDLKPWSNGPASSRKWTQVELAWRLALGGQTDSQVSSQVHATRKKRHIKADYPLFHWLVIG